MNWQYLKDNWVLCPPQPQGIIHFLGGAFIGTAPQIAYQKLLTRLAEEGYCIITPAFLLQPNHDAIAAEVTESLARCLQQLYQKNPALTSQPLFGFGHSLGAKLQILIGCQPQTRRAGMMLIAFNNFESDRAIPFANLISPLFSLNFTPSPSETILRAQHQYQQHQTLLIRFETDALDSSEQLRPLFREKFPRSFMDQTLCGDHLTPVNINPLSEIDGVNTTEFNNALITDPNLLKLEQVTLKWLGYQQKLFSRR